MAYQKIHTRNLITKKNSSGSKIPLPPPHNFSNSPSLSKLFLQEALWVWTNTTKNYVGNPFCCGKSLLYNDFLFLLLRLSQNTRDHIKQNGFASIFI